MAKLTFKWAKVKSEYANRKHTFNFISDATNSPFCYHLRDIHHQNVHDVDLDI